MKRKIAFGIVLGLLVAAATASAFHVHRGTSATSSSTPKAASPRRRCPARKRPDHPPRRRQDLDRLRRLPPILKTDPRIRPPRRRRTTGPRGLHAGKLDATDVPPPAAPARRDRRRGPRHRGRQVPRTGADQGLLADHPLQRPRRAATTVLAHAYLDVPAPTTFIVPIVIEPIHKGIYGYRTEAKIPKIAGGYGVPISGSPKIGKNGPTRA